MKRVSIFLVMVALIVGMVGCASSAGKYVLTITSTVGGTVIYPGEGIFGYDAGEVVNLVAIPEGGYYFIDWRSDVATIVEPHSASTIITMNGHYYIRARFLQGQPIWDWWDLHEIRHKVGGSYLLMNDLDSTTYGYDELASEIANNATGWQPIGTDLYPFTGTFDGQGYVISDLFIDRPNEDYVGVFGRVEWGGVIENVGVANANVTGRGCVGSLVGGLHCGSSYGVNNSYSIGIVSGYECIGGLVGYSDGDINNCYSSGNVSGISDVGGLIASNDGTISDSYSSSKVTGNSSVGGLVGENAEGTVNNCFWDTETSGQATSEGGTGKNTTEMQDIVTFSSAEWDIVAVANTTMRNPSYIWNIVNNVTYPFLSWEPVS